MPTYQPIPSIPWSLGTGEAARIPGLEPTEEFRRLGNFQSMLGNYEPALKRLRGTVAEASQTLKRRTGQVLRTDGRTLTHSAGADCSTAGRISDKKRKFWEYLSNG